MSFYKEEEIKALFALKKTGHKGWYLGECPWCGREKLAIIFNDEGVSSYVCKRGCSKGSLWSLLQYKQRLDLYLGSSNANPFQVLIDDINESIKVEEIVIEELPEKHPPRGFEYIESDEYLDKRGFTKEQYKIFNVGITTKDLLLKDYLIFLIKEQNKVIGYLARSKKSKEWIKLYNKKLKEKGIDFTYLRYRNSEDTSFEKILLGYEEIIKGETISVIIVEGLFDKSNIDNKLMLYESPEIKCVSTFGKKISPYQLKLLELKGVNLIFLYDPDAVEDIKNYSLNALWEGHKVLIGDLDLKDPGDLDLDEILEVMNNLKTPYEYYYNKVQSNNLK